MPPLTPSPFVFIVMDFNCAYILNHTRFYNHRTVNTHYIRLHIYPLCCFLFQYTFMCLWLEFFSLCLNIPLFRAGLLETISLHFCLPQNFILSFVFLLGIAVSFSKFFSALRRSLVSIIPLLLLWKVMSFFLWLLLVFLFFA